MRPADAANIFNALELRTLLALLDRMNDRKAALILASMQPERARLATQMLAQQRQEEDPDPPPEPLILRSTGMTFRSGLRRGAVVLACLSSGSAWAQTRISERPFRGHEQLVIADPTSSITADATNGTVVLKSSRLLRVTRLHPTRSQREVDLRQPRCDHDCFAAWSRGPLRQGR